MHYAEPPNGWTTQDSYEVGLVGVGMYRVCTRTHGIRGLPTP